MATTNRVQCRDVSAMNMLFDKRALRAFVDVRPDPADLSGRVGYTIWFQIALGGNP